MKKLSIALILALTPIACASSTDPTPAPTSSSSSGTSGTSGASGTTTSSSGSSGTTSSSSGSSGDTSSGATPVVPAAPKIDTVAKMTGALHVMWTNTEKSCDAIEVERKADMPSGESMEKYKVVFTLPGEADNKHDTSATEDMKYTYRLRCKKAATYSLYSNEMSGNPKQ